MSARGSVASRRAKSGRNLNAQNRVNDADQPLDESGLFYIIMYTRQLPNINMALVQGERSTEFGQFRNKSNTDNAMLFVVTDNPYYFLADLRDVVPMMRPARVPLPSREEIRRGNAAFLRANRRLIAALFPKLAAADVDRLLEPPVVQKIGRAAGRGAKRKRAGRGAKRGFYYDCSARNFSLLEPAGDAQNEDEERTVVCVMGPIATRQAALAIYRLWSPQLRGSNTHTARGARLANEFGVHFFINPYGFYMVDSRAARMREVRGTHAHRANVAGYSVRLEEPAAPNQ